MSDMSHVYKAYAAVHNSEKRNDLSEVRDEISEMNLKQLTDVDLYEVAEEVLEDVFAGGADIADAKKLIESIFTKASEGDANPFREDKIDRLAEAFISAFEKVTERSLRTAVESYSEYRINKERLEKWNDSNSTGNVNAKLHEKLVAQDRLIVKNGLKSMIESTVHGTSTNAKGEKIPWKVSTNKDGKSTVSDKFGSRPLNPVKREEQLKKRDKLFGSPKNEAYTVTRADIKANTPAAQGLKSGKKNVKTGEPLYKAADHLKKEELEAVFSEAEIKNILWTDFDENYQAMRNPEKAEAEAKKADKRSAREKRMADPEKGINSPAFREFMRSRGM